MGLGLEGKWGWGFAAHLVEDEPLVFVFGDGLAVGAYCADAFVFDGGNFLALLVDEAPEAVDLDEGEAVGLEGADPSIASGRDALALFVDERPAGVGFHCGVAVLEEASLLVFGEHDFVAEAVDEAEFAVELGDSDAFLEGRDDFRACRVGAICGRLVEVAVADEREIGLVVGLLELCISGRSRESEGKNSEQKINSFHNLKIFILCILRGECRCKRRD